MPRKILQGDFEKQQGIYYEYDPFSRPLGEGGMGVIYKGFRVNVSTSARQVVAIKAMKDGLPDEVYGRASREASIQLKNDNLVEMMGFISTTEQELGGRNIRRYYVISEYLNGVVLTDLLKGHFKNSDGIEIPFAKQLYTNYLSDKETTSVKIIKKVLSGIMALHDKGYIHRDIDPSNIMVTIEGNLKMIDFGIAKYVGDLGTQDNSRTATGKFIGKAEYAAPELVLGAIKDQHYTTDIYAIGILFYQLLVGKLPFEGPQYDILQDQLKKTLPLNNIPFKVYRQIIKKATAKKQSDRYQSCVEMRHAIDNAYSEIRWKNIPKYVALIAVICVIGYGVYYLINLEPGSKRIVVDSDSGRVISKVDEKDELFAKALKLVDSKDSMEAREGWTKMKTLADDGYQKARIEVGITIFPENCPGRSDSIINRRKTLGLKTVKFCRDDTLNLNESIKYLKGINNTVDVPDEAFLVLGTGLYRSGEEKEECKKILQIAKDRTPDNKFISEMLNNLNN